MQNDVGMCICICLLQGSLCFQEKKKEKPPRGEAWRGSGQFDCPTNGRRFYFIDARVRLSHFLTYGTIKKRGS